MIFLTSNEIAAIQRALPTATDPELVPWLPHIMKKLRAMNHASWDPQGEANSSLVMLKAARLITRLVNYALAKEVKINANTLAQAFQMNRNITNPHVIEHAYLLCEEKLLNLQPDLTPADIGKIIIWAGQLEDNLNAPIPTLSVPINGKLQFQLQQSVDFCDLLLERRRKIVGVNQMRVQHKEPHQWTVTTEDTAPEYEEAPMPEDIERRKRMQAQQEGAQV